MNNAIFQKANQNYDFYLNNNIKIESMVSGS